jgi:hypothetical protein
LDAAHYCSVGGGIFREEMMFDFLFFWMLLIIVAWAVGLFD